MIPALHLLFSPERLIRVTNRRLDALPGFKVSRHYEPAKHYSTNRPLLPMLNGMGLNDFRAAISDWTVASIELNSILDVAMGRGSALARATRRSIP